LTKNIQQKILSKVTFLSEKVDFVLQTELRDIKTYPSTAAAHIDFGQ